MTDEEKDTLSELREDIRDPETDVPQPMLAERLETVHPADLAEWMQDLDEDERWLVFSALDDQKRLEVIEEAEDNVRQDIVERLSPEQLRGVVEELPADEVVDLLALVDDKVSEEVLRSVDFERARELRALAEYEPDSAGGVMTTEFITVPSNTRVGDAIKQLKKLGEEGEEFEEGVGLFVVDEYSRPLGYVPLARLLTHSIHDTIDDAMTEARTVPVDEDQEEAANLIAKYGLTSLAVVDSSGCLVGVITADDAQEVLENEASEDMMRLVGTENVGQTRLPILTRVRQRIPLMAVTVVGGLATAWILRTALGGADDTGTNVAVLHFLPIVMGLAGNVGVQASTILVRAFATGEVEEDRELSVLFNEVVVGSTIGLLCGGMTALVAGLMESEGDGARFGAAVGCAIFIAVTWASLLGCVVPMGCRRLGIDPAIVAGPFLITLSDISGSAIFILAARLVIGL